MTTETIPLTQDQGGARPDGPGASRFATGADTVSAHSGDAPSRGKWRYLLRSSFGNDSVALIQWAAEAGLKKVVVTYSDTKWATAEWRQRVAEARKWVLSLGFDFVEIDSVGFRQNVFDQTARGMWPTGLRKHCTKYLKILPFLAWAKENDPDARAVVLVGVRRAESVARRGKPAFMLEADGGRHVLHPLIEFSDTDRDAMVLKTPLPLLPHKSDECAICIHANKEDLKRAPEEALAEVEDMESIVGMPMFHPEKKGWAIGIREVVKHAESERGKYEPSEAGRALRDEVARRKRESDLLTMLEDEPATCDDDWCGI